MKFLTIVFGPLLAVILSLLAVVLLAGAFMGFVAFPLILYALGLGGLMSLIVGEVIYLLWLGFFVALIEDKFSK